MRGFRGHIYASIRYLEDFSPGVTKRFFAWRRRWRRNLEPAREALLVAKIQGCLPKSRGWVRPPSKDRCTARSKQAGRRCWNWGHATPDGTRSRVCWMHGARAAPHGIKAWRKAMKWDGKQHRKMWVRVKKSDRFRGTDGVED
jgi:hypothetical protein